jgi:FKBP-type peptidyl-prolyl cis-trans isomerase FkpA
MNKSIPTLFAIPLLAMVACASAQGGKPGASETLPTGIVVKHTKVGTGASPAATDSVQVHYRGKMSNGKEFDSSYQRGKPASFPLGGVIPCWTEGLQKMKAGGAATLTCPPATAYGSRGAGGVIPPNATLTFDVELLAVDKKP